MAANNSDRMELSREVQTFKLHAKKLKKIFKDTVKVLADLQDFEQSLSLDQVLHVEAQKCISNVVSGHTAIAIMGDLFLRVRIINTILGEQMIPTPSNYEEKWRMIHFKHSKKRFVRHMVDGFDAVSRKDYGGVGTMLHREDLLVNNHKSEKGTVLEIGMSNSLLESGLELICAPSHSDPVACTGQVLDLCKLELHPFIIYAIDGSKTLSKQQCEELRYIKSTMPYIPVLFICASLTTINMDTPSHSHVEDEICQMLSSLGYLNEDASVTPPMMMPNPSSPVAISPFDPADTTSLSFSFIPVDKFVTSLVDFSSTLLEYVECNMNLQITNAASSLHDAHARCLQSLILAAHDLAREVMVTPKRIQYAREKEELLYKQLMDLSSKKQSEIKDLVCTTVLNIHSDIVAEVLALQFEGLNVSLSQVAADAKTMKKCQSQVQNVVYRKLSEEVSKKLVESVDYLRESVVGTLQRCLEHLEGVEDLQIDDTSRALKQILDAAYSLEFTERTSASAVRLFFERLKQTFRGAPWKNLKVDEHWKEKYVSQLIDGLSASKLAKNICSQFRGKVAAAHDTFEHALRRLEMHHSGRMKQNETQRDTIRKVLTPHMARLSLSSIALRDLILHGLPTTGRELGRGQYGVVYSCSEWANNRNLAIKSVLPPDEKHWNDLALEFHYTWSLPPNDYIVNLIGAVIDEDYSGGSGSVVLFIMPRFPRDLHSALKHGITKKMQLQIALDVVQGIRFLHSQGLLHRDIKLKNVLLDNNNRGRLTDLGFCKPEAMMTCTIVGTPIHMAPELFGGKYDLSVDIYAFGILFWYICSNDVKLPHNFEQCQNKEQLWTSVKKGLRPEKLPKFEAICWKLMCQCWDGDVTKRPLDGDVSSRLETMLKELL